MNERWASYTRRYEGLSVLPYRCPTGHLTIGYGHNLELGISKEVADVMLHQDMQAVQQAVAKRFAWWAQLNEVRQFVLVDMCFNIGLAKLCTFKKMIAALRRADYTAAATEMLNSRWAVQVGHRAQELAAMMKTGEYI